MNLKDTFRAVFSDEEGYLNPAWNEEEQCFVLLGQPELHVGVPICSAALIVSRWGRADGKVVGHFPDETSKAMFLKDGFDIAILDNRWVVDIFNFLLHDTDSPVYDMTDPADAAELDRLYGPIGAWEESKCNDLLNICDKHDTYSGVTHLSAKFHPERFGCSAKLHAILALGFGADWTTPGLHSHISITSDGFAVSGDHFLGSAHEVLENVQGAMRAANLTDREEKLYRQCFLTSAGFAPLWPEG